MAACCYRGSSHNSLLHIFHFSPFETTQKRRGKRAAECTASELDTEIRNTSDMSISLEKSRLFTETKSW